MLQSTMVSMQDAPLYVAAAYGRRALVERLLRARAELSLPSRRHHGRRPLHAAASNGHFGAVGVLVAAGTQI
eukprot:SAG31_NODE_21808_length_540_cov_1.049887_2_plen_72_part_00